MSATTTQTASWGVRTSHGAVGSGVCISWDETVEPIMAPEHNEVGAVIGQAVYDVRHTVRATYNIPASAATGLSNINTVQEILSYSVPTGYYVTSAEVVESNSDYMKINVGLEMYEHCTSGWNASTGAS